MRPALTRFRQSIGDSAKNAFHANPANTVFDAKRLIGRKYNDPDVQKDLKHWCVHLILVGLSCHR